MERREFIGAVTATALGGAPAAQTTPKETRKGDMVYRHLGSTGEEVSVIGPGGHHVNRQKDETDSIAIISSAVDAGVTFLDNCWDYHGGVSEVRMGQALQDGYRQRVFPM